MRKSEGLIIIVVALLLASPLLASEWELSPSSAREALADVAVQPDLVTLTPRAEFKGIHLVIAGPEGIVFDKEFTSSPVTWRIEDMNGKPLPDGRYNFELRFNSGVAGEAAAGSMVKSDTSGTSRVTSGAFSIENGRINTTYRASVPSVDAKSLRRPMEEPTPKAYNYTFLFVESKIGIGIDDSQGVPDAALQIQESSPTGILLEERAGAYGTAIEGQWRIRGTSTNFTIGHNPNASGTERENIVIEENAPANQLYLDSTGKIGFGTSTPVADFQIASVNGWIRIQDTNDSTWDIEELAGDLNFNLITPEPATSDVAGNKFHIDGSSRIGIGTTSPQAILHVRRTAGDAKVFVEEANAASALRTLFEMKNNGPVNTMHETGAATWRQQFQDNAYTLTKDGTGGNEMTIIAGSGNMYIRGKLYTAGPTCAAGCDAVLRKGYDLDTIEQHAAAMWAGGYLPAIGPTEPEQQVNLSDKLGGVLNELEKAHIYIDQLNTRLRAKDDEVSRLASEVSELRAMVQALAEQASVE